MSLPSVHDNLYTLTHRHTWLSLKIITISHLFQRELVDSTTTMGLYIFPIKLGMVAKKPFTESVSKKGFFQPSLIALRNSNGLLFSIKILIWAMKNMIIWDAVCCEFYSTKILLFANVTLTVLKSLNKYSKFPKYHGRQNYQQLALWAFDACGTLCLLMNPMCSSQPVHQMENIETANQTSNCECCPVSQLIVR